MELTVLDNIALDLDSAAVLKRLKMEGMDGLGQEVAVLVGQALEVGRPRACCGVAGIGELGRDYAVLDGERFTSRILRVNLGGNTRAAFFVATCGRELERWAESQEDFLLRFCAEEICELALRSAAAALEKHLETRLGGPYVATMNPGSLPDWPLTQQTQLFRALGDVRSAVGVELTESFLMRPRKSLSGIGFATPEPYSNCQLCPREDCPGRRMPFDSMKYSAKYAEPSVGGALEGEGCRSGNIGSAAE
jgi:hypothetical protein